MSNAIKKLSPEQRKKFLNEESKLLEIDPEDDQQSLNTHERDLGEIEVKKWPDPMGEDAYYGLTGKVVKAIDPFSESDPAALLVTWLTEAGNFFHRSVNCMVGADEHYCNLFSCVVGASSKARKGMSGNFIKQVFEAIDSIWTKTKITNGLTSGEGLIFAVRDQVTEKKPIKEKKSGPVIGYEDVIIDEGVADKRLMIVESEFAQVLQVMARQGNTLSPVMRQAWDNGNLSTLTKNFRNRATEAYISVIGHITTYELQGLLQENEMLNGFGNRFLWVMAKRSKFLPAGAVLPDATLQSLVLEVDKIKKFVGLATLIKDEETGIPLGQIPFSPKTMHRTPEAAEYWASIYPELSSEKPGFYGSMTSRAEAQVLRISMIYALLDCSEVIKIEHISAALAVWKYCDQSANYLFGGRSNNPVAEEIRIALGARGPMTQTEIVKLFDNHKPATEIKRALEELLESGVIVNEKDSSGKGRPVTIWKLA